MKERPNRAASSHKLASIAKQNGFFLTKEELLAFRRPLLEMLASCERVEKLTRGYQKIKRERLGRSPHRLENPFNAWAWKCSLKYTRRRMKNQKLRRKRIGIKDNVLVAGIPLRNGSPLLKNYVPSIDATIVTRILESGGEISGKSTCENLCTSSGSHTSYPRPVKNPLNPDYMAGGSSSGSAALVANGEVDMAIGGDQAGSIRIPSSWCGIYGLKPTFGLVPYTGVIGMETVLDHVGPMAQTVENIALLLEVIAGRDGSDPRQLNVPFDIPSYSRELRKSGTRRLKIGLVKEGFAWNGTSDPKVDYYVRDAAYQAQDDDATTVSEISIPIHRDAIHIWSCICRDGIWNNVVRANGLEHLWSGDYDIDLVEGWSRALGNSPRQLSEIAKLVGLVGKYTARKFDGRYYALAQNLRKRLIHEYDLAFGKFDLLLMPTTPQRAQLLSKDGNLDWMIESALSNIQNTCAFDVSGHPALNVPLKSYGGLPIGLMLVGKYYDEATLLEAAKSFERIGVS